MNKPANVKITNELKNPSEAGRHYRLLCMTGPSKGKVFYLQGKRIIIGRGENADIQIVDVKMSREHAELSFANNSYTVTDLGAQNGIIVNDAKVMQAKLEDSEKLVIGQTVFKYNIIEVAGSDLIVGPETKSNKLKIQIKSKPINDNDNDTFRETKNSESEEKKGKPKFIIIVLVVLVGGYLFLDGGDANKPAPTKKTEVTNDFDKDNSPLMPTKGNQEDTESKKKLENYIHSGRREFGEGNYFRAMEDFRLALLLSPNNGHASFYLSKAKQSLDDDINKNFLKGKQEYEARKLQAAIVSYCSVVQLIQNYPDDERYKNAMLKISAIESELGLEKGEIKCFEEKSAESKN